MNTQPPIKVRGRPRSFNEERALDAAMQVFWSKGYEGSSLSDLTEAMGINRPSLYAAYGDKNALFRRVLDRYEDVSSAYVREALQQAVARTAVEQLLQGSADLATHPQNPRGCLMVQSALACGEGAEAIQKELGLRRKAGEQALRQRLERAQAEGDLPRNTDAADLARYVLTVMHGLAVQAVDGASREELQKVIDTALRAWPK